MKPFSLLSSVVFWFFLLLWSLPFLFELFLTMYCCKISDFLHLFVYHILGFSALLLLTAIFCHVLLFSFPSISSVNILGAALLQIMFPSLCILFLYWCHPVSPISALYYLSLFSFHFFWFLTRLQFQLITTTPFCRFSFHLFSLHALNSIPHYLWLRNIFFNIFVFSHDPDFQLFTATYLVIDFLLLLSSIGKLFILSSHSYYSCQSWGCDSMNQIINLHWSRSIQILQIKYKSRNRETKENHHPYILT